MLTRYTIDYVIFTPVTYRVHVYYDYSIGPHVQRLMIKTTLISSYLAYMYSSFLLRFTTLKCA